MGNWGFCRHAGKEKTCCLPTPNWIEYPIMRTRIAAIVLCAFTASSCAILGSRPESPDPVVWVDTAQHDFGDITGAETVSHVFTVKNKGGKPLNILRVQTSCGCTAAVLDKQFLKPGEASRLKVTFDPRGRHGQNSRTVYINSNDPKTPQKQITITANIAPPPSAPQPQITGTIVPPAGSPSATVLPSSPAVSSTVAAPVQAAPATVTAPSATTVQAGQAAPAKSDKPAR